MIALTRFMWTSPLLDFAICDFLNYKHRDCKHWATRAALIASGKREWSLAWSAGDNLAAQKLYSVFTV
jgi:hypothetical protein